jgi:hypothetical protein
VYSKHIAKLLTCTLLVLVLLPLQKAGAQAMQYNKTFLLDPPSTLSIYGWGLQIHCINDSVNLIATVTSLPSLGTHIKQHNYVQLKNTMIADSVRLKLADTNFQSDLSIQTLWLTDTTAIEMLYAYWYVAGNVFDTLHLYPVMQFIKSNANGVDTTYQRRYGTNFENEYANIIYSGHRLYSTGLALGPISNMYEIAITSFDTIGNVIWHRTTGMPNRMDRGINIAAVGDDKLLIASVCNQINTSNGFQDTKNRIYCYDTSGNELWYKDLWENNASLYIAMAPCATENKKFYFSAWRDTILSLPNNGYGGVFELSMLDSLANPLWTHMFTELPSELMGIYNIKALANGNVMLCGSISDKQGWACQMRPDASIVWQHTYTSSSTSNFNILTNCDRAPNGDFVFCGTSLDSTYNRQATWILRVDSNGCLVPSACSPLGAVQYDIVEPLRISAYPNPATDNLYLQSNSTQHLLSGKVQVFNLQGQQLYSQAVEGVTMHNIGLQNLAAGTYFWRYESKRGEVISSKFVKN